MFHNPLPTNKPIAAPQCSIPSRYQTYVVDNADKKGFNSGTRRFHSLELTGNDTPGPGHYNPTNHEIQKKTNTTNAKYLNNMKYSRKAPVSNQQTAGIKQSMSRSSACLYDDLISNSKFQTPGPNNYNVSKPLTLRKDFHRAHSSSFQSVRRDTQNFQTPAPNVYNPLAPKTKAISSSFRSSSQRMADIADSTDTTKRVPSPTHYLVRDNVVKSNVRAPTSCFVSTAHRSEISKKSARDAFYTSSGTEKYRSPGPAVYGEISRWGLFKKRQEIARRGYYLAISAPAIPLPPARSLPGPGEYELVDYSGPKKTDRASSMFCSNTDRWSQEQRNSYISKQLPGPASYNPKRLNNQSFIFNANRHWIN